MWTIHLQQDTYDNISVPESPTYPTASKPMGEPVQALRPIPITYGLQPNCNLQSTDRTDNRDFTPNAPDMRMVSDRINTFQNWPVPFLKPETLAENGFYYLGRGDEVRCAFCKVEIMRWEPGDDPATDHRRWAPQCPFLSPICSGASSPTPASDGRDECGTSPSVVRMPTPANRNYKTYASRLASYADWPLSLRQKPEDLADAGFFYTGHGDKTKCFYCDGGLKDWEDNDIPWEQHARWFDRCPFVVLVKGKEYIQRVLAEASTKSSTHTEKKESPKEQQPPVVTNSEKSTALDDEKLCKICYEEERNVCFVPCGHVVACAKCALSNDKCPTCRGTYVTAIRLYYS